MELVDIILLEDCIFIVFMKLCIFILFLLLELIIKCLLLELGIIFMLLGNLNLFVGWVVWKGLLLLFKFIMVLNFFLLKNFLMVVKVFFVEINFRGRVNCLGFWLICMIFVLLILISW